MVHGDSSGRAVSVNGDANVFFALPADLSIIQNNLWVVQVDNPSFNGQERHVSSASESALTATGIGVAMPNPNDPLFTHFSKVTGTQDGTGIRDFGSNGYALLLPDEPTEPSWNVNLGSIGTAAGAPPAPSCVSPRPSRRCLRRPSARATCPGAGPRAPQRQPAHPLPDAGPRAPGPDREGDGVLPGRQPDQLSPDHRRQRERAGAAQWTYSDAGLVLKNCLLYVNGNVDLTKGPKGDPTKGTLVGDNATLIVGGTLRITSGFLDSGDHGFVILARGISLEAGGYLQRAGGGAEDDAHAAAHQQRRHAGDPEAA